MIAASKMLLKEIQEQMQACSTEEIVKDLVPSGDIGHR
jgi:hypothetical protein